MSDTKLDPATLTAEERAIWDRIADKVYFEIEEEDTPDWCECYEIAREEAVERILARRALFGTATEKVKESKFPVGHCQVCGELVAPYNKHAKYEGGYTCQPAQPAATVDTTDEQIAYARSICKQPEPAAPVNGSTPVGEYDPDMKPAAPEMPEAVYIAANTLRASGHVTLADALLKEAWHSQPVAVGMTEELSMVLLRAEYGATEDERNPNLRDGYVARLKSAIETVRQQAAQVKL